MLALAPLSAAVACAPQKAIIVEHAEFSPPLGVTGIGAAYFSIRSATNDRIIAVTSSQAASIEIHASVTNGDRVTMHRVDSLDLPAGETIWFAPGAFHLMVFSPRTTASEATFPITIELQSGARETVSFKKVTRVTEHSS